jgi:4'-phosphopantetheinyl transferase
VNLLSQPGVDVWQVGLDREGLVEEARGLLSPDEAARASHLAAAAARRFVACRGQVRRILASYLPADPARLRFRYGPGGKPALDGPFDGLRFNVSHSGGLALVGVAWEREVGIDVECLDYSGDFASLARAALSPAEHRRWAGLAPDAGRSFLLRAWALKEAYFKATGQGLVVPPAALTVLAGKPPAVVVSSLPAAGWWLTELPAVPGHAAAVCLQQGDACPIRMRTWSAE